MDIESGRVKGAQTLLAPMGATLAIPEKNRRRSAWDVSVPLALSIRETKSELEATYKMGELQTQIQRQLAEVRREVRENAERDRVAVRTETSAAQEVTRQELRLLKEAQEETKEKAGQVKVTSEARHGELMDVLQAMQGMMSAQGAAVAAVAAAVVTNGRMVWMGTSVSSTKPAPRQARPESTFLQALAIPIV